MGTYICQCATHMYTHKQTHTQTLTTHISDTDVCTPIPHAIHFACDNAVTPKAHYKYRLTVAYQVVTKAYTLEMLCSPTDGFQTV